MIDAAAPRPAANRALEAGIPQCPYPTGTLHAAGRLVAPLGGKAATDDTAAQFGGTAAKPGGTAARRHSGGKVIWRHGGKVAAKRTAYPPRAERLPRGRLGADAAAAADGDHRNLGRGGRIPAVLPFARSCTMPTGERALGCVGRGAA
eukprot:gene14621-biopygen1511